MLKLQLIKDDTDLCKIKGTVEMKKEAGEKRNFKETTELLVGKLDHLSSFSTANTLCYNKATD